MNAIDNFIKTIKFEENLLDLTVKKHIKIAYALFLLFINSSRNRGLLFSLLGILTLVIAIGVTAGTASSASDKPGLYVVYIGESSLNIFPLVIRERSKVSVQGVVALDGHFATLCPELDFYEAILFVINFQKEKANTFTVLIIHSFLQ